MPRKFKRSYNLLKDPRYLQMQAMMDPEAQKPLSAKRTPTLVNVGESPLTWLYSRGHLNERQLLAGNQMRFYYERANLGPQVTMNWDRLKTGRVGGSSGAPDAGTARLLTSKDKFDAALQVLGRDLADIAWRVICSGQAISGAERSLGWPVRSGKLVLRIALDRLADHFGIPGG